MKHFLKQFRRSDDGSVTVEAVLWLPAFIFFFVMVADTSVVFFRQAQAMRIVQDANRALSVKNLADEEATQNYVLAGLRPNMPGTTVVTVIDNGIITTTAAMPVVEMTAVGFFSFLQGYDVEVKSQHFVEY